MSARSGVSTSKYVDGAVRTPKRRKGLHWMSARQTEAYFIARDALRRIERTTPLVLPSLEAASKSVARSEAPYSLDRSDFGGPVR
jgi:hypothetical protein